MTAGFEGLFGVKDERESVWAGGVGSEDAEFLAKMG